MEEGRREAKGGEMLVEVDAATMVTLLLRSAHNVSRLPVISAPRSNQSEKKRYESLGTTSFVFENTVLGVILYLCAVSNLSSLQKGV